MIIRVGVEGGRRALLSRATQLEAPLLVSANSLWDDRRSRFSGWDCYAHHDVALDSGGFVAMKRYGRYRWTVEQYVALAAAMRPTWWAQMDFCCEPEIASDPTAVAKRIDATAAHLHECQSAARSANLSDPMPVLQGWSPSEYCDGPIYDAGYLWPSLVGIGSVCRRQVNGPQGVVAVVEALNRKVPAHVQFHLFGVKSQAIAKLRAEFPNRIASMDSMAWNMAARWDALHAGIPCDSAFRAESMGKWFIRQQQLLQSNSQTVLAL